jgi:hypothetical protein
MRTSVLRKVVISILLVAPIVSLAIYLVIQYRRRLSRTYSQHDISEHIYSESDASSSELGDEDILRSVKIEDTGSAESPKTTQPTEVPISREESVRTRGIENFNGLSCYAISLLQMLFHEKEFRRGILRMRDTKYPFVDTLKRLFERMADDPLAGALDLEAEIRALIKHSQSEDLRTDEPGCPFSLMEEIINQVVCAALGGLLEDSNLFYNKTPTPELERAWIFRHFVICGRRNWTPTIELKVILETEDDGVQEAMDEYNRKTPPLKAMHQAPYMLMVQNMAGNGRHNMDLNVPRRATFRGAEYSLHGTILCSNFDEDPRSRHYYARVLLADGSVATLNDNLLSIGRSLPLSRRELGRKTIFYGLFYRRTRG